MRITEVLVVDDDLKICRIIHWMLSDEQYKVQITQSVADALRAVEQKHFDAYVIDCILPDGSGLEIAERIRSKWGAAPIILISGYDPRVVALNADKLRVSEFLEKPFSRDMICETVKKAFNSPKAPSELSPAAAPSISPEVSEPTRTRFWQRPAKRPAS